MLTSRRGQIEIQVTLLLAGGHREVTRLALHDPVLQQLLSIKLNKQDAFLEIALDAGRKALYVDSADIVAVITEPPLPRSAQAQSLPSNYLQIDNFLSAEAHARLIAYAIEHESEFAPSNVDADVTGYRHSLVLHDFPEFSLLMRKSIEDRMDSLLAFFQLPGFTVFDIECQLTAHNDGHFYKVHNDNGSAGTANRMISYVYYFNQQPKAYTGGELRLYDTRVQNNIYVADDNYHDVVPRDNSIVFFLPRYLHEVLPVSCPDRKFANSRFTINGWVRQTVTQANESVQSGLNTANEITA